MRTILFILLFLVPIIGISQTTKEKELEEIVVTAQRPLREVGVQKTTFDSLALKENVALSMADVLTFNSSVFVKSHGRASLSTVSFRGTSPSHTQVTWNGLRINSPMLGMTDFSTIPAFFVDRASLLHGTSSVNETGGGLGGLVRLSTVPDLPDGFNLQYVQGIGSFFTFDEFLRFGYSNKKLTVSTRALFMSSKNNYRYVNHDKKENIYDDDHNIIGQYYPEERNRSGAYKDFHILQEIYYNTLKGDRLGFNAWYVSSNRELPLLTTDFSDEKEFENRQREQTLRTLFSWDHVSGSLKTGLKAGYVHTWLAYDYKREITPDNWSSLTRSRSRVNTLFGNAEGSYYLGNSWLFTADFSVHQQFVRSTDNNIIKQDGNMAVVGYDKARIELSAALSAKWQPIDRLGMSVVVREDVFGKRNSPLIPAFFIDGLLSRDGRLTAKASFSKNYRFPSLNDLYFLPGGNPDLKSEHGLSYDIGFGYTFAKSGLLSLEADATWFDSRIKNWILWLPTTKGFFSPRNVGKVHAYGVEIKAALDLIIIKDLFLKLEGSYSWTPSINQGEKLSPADNSVDRQLPYIPENSASITGRLSWKSWSFLYKWAYYSKRYTMSSNEQSFSGILPDYFMSNISLEKNFDFRYVGMQLKFTVNNLFNEDYLSVLSRPMPGINFEFFIGFTPKFL